jgi:hemoglobin
MKSSATLWSRLGGEPAVRAVVHEFVALGANNPKVNFVRQGKPNEWKPKEGDIAKLEQRLVEFISEHTGGPLKYKGRDMVTAHRGMQISNDEFDALAADLGAALDKFKVAKKEKDELIAVVAGTRGQIVGK